MAGNMLKIVVALRRQQSAGGLVRDGEAAALAARKRAYRARLRSVQVSRHSLTHALPSTTSYGNVRDGDPAWSERIRRRKVFADAALEQGACAAPPEPAPAAFCRHLLAALLTYAPPPPPRSKISFSIESIIGVQ